MNGLVNLFEPNMLIFLDEINPTNLSDLTNKYRETSNITLMDRLQEMVPAPCKKQVLLVPIGAFTPGVSKMGMGFYKMLPEG